MFQSISTQFQLQIKLLFKPAAWYKLNFDHCTWRYHVVFTFVLIQYRFKSGCLQLAIRLHTVLCFLSCGEFTQFSTILPRKRRLNLNTTMSWSMACTELACINVKHAQIFKDWELMVLTLIVTGVAAFLLFLGSVIPPLRGTISETTDPEYADGLSVRNTRPVKINNNLN